jgi:pilus assembly protein CpaE
MEQLSFVIVSSRMEIGAALEQIGCARVKARVSWPDSLSEAVHRHRPDALLVDLIEDAEARLDEIEALPVPRPLMLACGPADDGRVVLRAMRLGAREFLSPDPDPDTLRASIEHLANGAASNQRAVPRASEGTVIAVLGAKGGVGATTVACQLAVGLQDLGDSTALLDLALPQGDAALHLDLQPAYALVGAAREAEALDATFLRTLLSPHRSGVQLLAATERAEEAELLRAEPVERALALLRADFDWVVVDLGRSWSEGSVRALDLASEVILVTELDVPALANARRQLELLERLGVSAGRVHVVENRHGRAEALTGRDSRRFLGRPVELRLPDEPAAAGACVNEGRTVGEAARNGRLHRAVVELAQAVHEWSGRETALPARSGVLARVRLGLARRVYGAA